MTGRVAAATACSILLVLASLIPGSIQAASVEAGDERPSEASEAGGKKGQVLGSIEIRYNKSGTFLGKMNEAMRSSDWTVLVAREGRGEFTRATMGGDDSIEVTEEVPRTFVRTLRANTYEIYQAENLVAGSTMVAPIKAHFRVTADRRSYIGRLVIEVNARKNVPEIQVHVEDARDEDFSSLRQSDPDLSLDGVVTDLMAGPGETLPPLEVTTDTAPGN